MLAAKVPAITLGFWLVKLASTTLGETGGDAVTMSLNLGYFVGTLIFATVLVIALRFQIGSERFRPMTYWFAIIATTTVGTTLADFVDRSLGIGYAGGVSILLAGVLASLFAWHRALGSIAVGSVSTPRAEAFYWLTILFSQTLGTALGDWTADTQGLGYTGGLLLFGSALALLAVVHLTIRRPSTLLFWCAFVLTRPLGAVLGDFLDKPVDHGGLELSRFTATLVLLGLIGGWLILFPQKPAQLEGDRAGHGH